VRAAWFSATIDPCHAASGDAFPVTRNQGSSASLVELALIIVLIAIIVMAILLIVGEDLRLWVVNTIQQFFPAQ
jgi:Flp pilus assembly pilin Flp